jgi:hypothetical protein
MVEQVLRIVDSSVRLSAEPPMRPHLPIASGDWSAYPTTVVRWLARDCGPLYTGLDLSFTSHLPLGLRPLPLERLGRRLSWLAGHGAA